MKLSSLPNFLYDNRAELGQQVMEHLTLTLSGLILAIIFGLLLGLWIAHYQKPRLAVLGAVSVVQTIPSIALLGLMLPLLGIGALPAIMALFLYGLLPIVRNTYTGVTKIDPAIIEAARGMGMREYQVLSKVKLPLAMPVIFAGIRTAAVINVGVATLCALIAAGGLGKFIFRGIALNNTLMILSGAIPAAILALLMDFLFGMIQKKVKKPRTLALAGFLILLFPLAAWFLQFEADNNQRLTAGFPSEFIKREDGYQGLKKTYQLDLRVREMEISLMYQALVNDKVDLISGFSTDGKIQAYDLRRLEDDRHYFPPYFAAPLATQKVLNDYPELNEVFAKLHNQVSKEDMTAMNHKVEAYKLAPEEVARSFLKQKGFQVTTERNGNEDLIIGSKNFTESFILAHLFAILIENYTSLDAGLELGFGGTQLLFEALNNKNIQLYPEYTGTGFLTVLKPDSVTRIKYMSDPDALYAYVKEKYLDRYGLLWLEPLGFNNTYAILMKESKAEELDISTLSDLSR